jgi:predicted transcriptional regulator
MKSSFNSSEQNSQKVASELQDLKTKLREQRKLSESATSSNKKFVDVMSRSKDILHKIVGEVEDALNTAVDKKLSPTKTELKENGDG